MSAIELSSQQEIKCVVDGIHSVTGSDGPQNAPAGKSFKKIRQASRTDLVTGLDLSDFNKVLGLHMELFVAGDCDVLTDDRKTAIWEAILNGAEFYWENDSKLPNGFPRNKFTEPRIDCIDTTILDLVDSLDLQWLSAQSE